MNVKLIAVLFAVLMLSSLAAAAAPAIAVLNSDGNYYYPSRDSGTINIEWTATDADAPIDFNFELWYVNVATTVRTEITAALPSTNVPDRNQTSFCASSVGVAAQVCSYTWTIPTGFDTNYYIDVNGYDITNSDDTNAESASLYFDTNACDTSITITGDDASFLAHCTGAGGPAGGGRGTDLNAVYYSLSRIGGCADNYKLYSEPVKMSLGEFTICYYSVDGIGNTETTQSALHTASSSAYNLALLVEMLLAALLLMVILGAVVLRGEELNATLVIGLLLAAVIIVISIYIYAVIL